MGLKLKSFGTLSLKVVQGVTVKIQAGVDYKFVTGPASARVPLQLYLAVSSTSASASSNVPLQLYPLPTLNKLAMTLPQWKVMVLTRRVQSYILALTVKYEKSYCSKL